MATGNREELSRTPRSEGGRRGESPRGEESRGMTRRGEGGELGRREEFMPTVFTSPFTLMSRLWDDMDRLFDDFSYGRGFPGPFRGSRGGRGLGESAMTMLWPNVDISQRDNRLKVEADLPGLNAKDVNVNIEEGHLVISGERRYEHEGEEQGMRRIERSYGRFHRAIPLPEGANEDEIKATFRNGVLEVEIPLRPEAAPRGRRIEIREGREEGTEPKAVRGETMKAGSRQGNM